jgi:DNA polymerase
MDNRVKIRALLEWYAAAGVDEAIDPRPHNRFSPSTERQDASGGIGVVPSSPERRAPPPPEPAPRRRAEPHTTSDAARSAREAASACRSLDDLSAALSGFEGCALKRTATTTVIGDGNPAAPLMIVGEAPGAEEDRQGLPFVGAAGRLLDRMLSAISLDRQGAYITNILPWRPPGNRTPTAEEIAVCQPFVERQIELIGPRVLVLVGGISAKALLNRTEGITRLRGRWYQFATEGLAAPIDTMATFHPAYLLRQPAAKREAWRDWLAVQERLVQGD